MERPHVLILGGTGEARRLGERLDADGRLRVTLSLAGRTAAPLPQAGTVRSGGFGGAEGLAAFLRAEGVHVLVDATHPFAARISENAASAAREAGVKLVALERPPWQPVEGDRWIEAKSVSQAASLLGERSKKVFLAIGRQELFPFVALPQHVYLVRSVDPVSADVLPGAKFVLERGPFDEAAERLLMEEHTIETVMAKNSGGAATYAKIAAARALKLPVVMVARPGGPRADAAETVDEAFSRVLHEAGLPPEKRGE